MKSFNFASVFFVLFSSVIGLSAPNESGALPQRRYFQPKHMDIAPDATSTDYQKIFRVFKDEKLDEGKDVRVQDQLDEVVTAGERNLDWLKYINSFRAEGQKLSFTGPNNRIGYPIDKPNAYNEQIILESYSKFMAESPEQFRAVIVGDKALPKEPAIPTAEYLELGRKLDRHYQSALRWRMMIPYKQEMIANQVWDIRGYYFLSQYENLEEMLTGFNNLPADEQTVVRGHLLSVCRNSELSKEDCSDQLKKDLKLSTKGALMFYRRYVKTSKAMFEYFFQIPKFAIRSDINWTSQDPLNAKIPFLEPEAAIKNFMLNVEDEWKWNGWQLHLDFLSHGIGVPHIEFEAGSTPHVNELGGNVITMDANTPLTEWEVGWTIRHEFGHVLGFPDCYVEFYNTDIDAMMNYQIDTTNLMCSRQGNLKETHYNEMKRVYFKEK